MFDLILQGGTVYDGKGSAPYVANVCIREGRIAAITQETMAAKETVDVTGLAVAPGFIDIHTHSDAVPFLDPTPGSAISQGVTTEIIGNCGSGCMPGLAQFEDRCREYNMQKRSHPGFLSVTDYADAITQTAPSGNYGPLLGHSNLRIAVMGFVNRQPTDEEQQQLCDLLEREMQRGAFGMSLGLIYPPSAFSAMDELVALAKVIAKYDGILAVHMRNEGPRIFQAVEEVIQIARHSGVHVQISHLKLMGKPQWGKAKLLTDLIESARAEGLNITCDQYPFPASSTSLTALVPHWAHDGGREALLGRLEAREGSICREIAQEMENRGGPETILVVSAAQSGKHYVGKYISQIASQLSLDPVETVRKILLDCGGVASGIYFCIHEEDIHHIMQKKYVCVGSDSSARSYRPGDKPHPRNFAAFSQYFQTVREHQLLSLQDMVYKATGLTASILGIPDRGILQEGAWADIAVFDGDRFASRSTFLDPSHPPVGMEHVLVNGVFALRDGVLQNSRSGKAILKP